MKQHHNNSDKKSINPIKHVWIIIASLFLAIAVAVTCALCFSNKDYRVTPDGGAGGSVSTSTTYANRTGNLINVLNNGDILTYAYNGSYYSVTLPQGTYKLEVWGGQGGGYSATAYGGKGGYTYGQVVFNDTTTVYIYPGGAGQTRGTATVFNGGGRLTTAHNGGSGGGASHIATASGVLSALGANNNNILVVAGGGGGYGCGCAYTSYAPGSGGGGRSNGTNAPANHTSTNRGGGYGGTLTAGGARGVGNGSAAGTFGQGANQTSAGSGSGGGAGGGGYYGGGSGGADYPNHNDFDDGHGGGGSGYVNTSRVTNYGGTTGAWYNASATSAAGKAQITAINVNQSPAAKNGGVTVNGNVRGSTAAVTITPDTIAVDPDINKTALHFTDGTVGAYDTYTTPGRNTKLWLNSACTQLATSYIDWEWSGTAASGNTTLSITNFKLYPRSGVDGCTANGRLTLYTKVRDTYGSGTSTRGCGVIMFYLNFPANTVTRKTATVNTVVTDPVLQTPVTEHYFLGMSNTSVVPDGPVESGSVFNPAHTSSAPRYTAILEKSLRINTPFTIKAADLLGGVVSYDKVVMALDSTIAITGNTRNFYLQEYDNASSPNRITAYNSNKVLIANTFDQITLVCLKPDPTFQVFPVTLYVVEKTTAYGNATSNVVPGIAAINLDIVFKMDNTRPVLRSVDNGGYTVEPVVKVQSLHSTQLNLANMYYDADTAITSAIHQIKSVKVATHEYIQLDKYNNVVSSYAADGGSYFNIVPNKGAEISQALIDDAQLSGVLNSSQYATGFENWYITDGASNVAFIQYSFSGSILTINGLRATHNMYNSDRENGGVLTSILPNNMGNAFDTTYGENLRVHNAGHFYILINVVDRNDPADAGIWLPLGIEVTNSAPNELEFERDRTGSSTMPTANGAPEETFYFTPMGITLTNDDGERVTHPLGYYSSGNGYITYGLRALASDADNYHTNNMLNDGGFINDLLTIKNINSIQSSVPGNAGGEYFVVEPLSVYVPISYFGGRIAQPEGETEEISINGSTVECVIVQGIKITLKSWTHNRYLLANVVVADSCDDVDSPSRVNVSVAINVSNVAPRHFATTESTKVVQLSSKNTYEDQGKSISSTYSVSDNIPVITYTVPVDSTIFITPYDLLTDENMTKSGVSYPSSGFTLNGLSGIFENGRFTVLEKGNNQISVEGIASSANNGYDYSSGAYREALKSTLSQLQATRRFTYTDENGEHQQFAVDNLYGTARTDAFTTNVDRLYFARTTDGANLDGYTFNPYIGTFNESVFERPEMVGAFVTPSFGTTLYFNNSNETFNIDFLALYANSRTPSGKPVTIDVKVRDRMGAATAGGVKTIRIAVDIVNSTPRVQYPDYVYQLTTNPIGDANFTITDARGPFTVVPSTLVINATNSTVNRNQNFLIDNEKDAVSFYTPTAVRVVDEQGNSSYDGKNYLGSYLQVSLTSQTITITALNSTQSNQVLYVIFDATDGVSTNGRDIDHKACRIKVEVLNAKPEANTGANGFDVVSDSESHSLNVWTVESVTDSDIVRERYFASNSSMVRALNTVKGVSSSQVRTVVTDTDRLQGAVLSPVAYPNNEPARRYYYNGAPLAEGASDLTAYKSMVPRIATRPGSAVGVIIEILKGAEADGDLVDRDTSLVAPGQSLEDSTQRVEMYDIVYYVNGEMYYASQLRSESDTTIAEHVSWFFDDDGRWKVTDWAVVVQPGMASYAGEYIRLGIMLRDETRFGGDSAGLVTGFENENSAIVDGFGMFYYHLSIGAIGIVPYTYYNQFDGYYVVADGKEDSTYYVSTYDGDIRSQYVYPDGDDYAYKYKDIYLSDGTISTTAGSGARSLKERAANSNDGTNAGIHSGETYQLGKEYTYSGNEKAFKYSDTIKISGDGSEDHYVYTFVPMSYFATRKGFTQFDSTSGLMTYRTNSYVSYDLGKGEYYDRGRVTSFAAAITVSDGSGSWTGTSLNSNPYVFITGFDVETTDVTDPTYIAVSNGEYFNKMRAITTVQADGTAEGFITNTASQADANRTNLVGNGHIMYLAGQERGITENLFGLGISKKNTRASASTLTISIRVVECRYDGTENKTVRASDDSVTVTYKLDIGNSPITLKTSGTETTGVQIAAGKGYYTKVEMTTSDPSYSFVLSRNAPTVTPANTTTILYNDADQVIENGVLDETRSDKAFFFADSMNKLNSWELGKDKYQRVASNNSDMFVNSSSDTNAQNSMKNYFGTRDSITHAFTPYAGGTVSGDLQPNGGIYGSNMHGDNGKEGYSSYFSTAVSSDGSTLTVSPNAKTTINSKVIDGLGGVPVSQAYNERGLEYDNGRGYYPLKILIYDSHGDGFEVGSYVTLEIRIYITSSAPVISNSGIVEINGNKTLNVSLPVRGSYLMNISKFVRSNDLLYNVDEDRLFWEKDYNDLYNKADKSMEDRFKLDSGTYLKSPFGDAKYGWVNTDTNSDALLNGNAKLGDRTRDVSQQPDVLMSLDYTGTFGPNAQATGNSIRIAVNRRTTVADLPVGSTRGKEFDFKILFTDSDDSQYNNHSTDWLTIHVIVSNQNPTIRQSDIDSVMRDGIRMRVGDKFTILTTPYDKFIGSETATGTVASTAARLSTSNQAITTGINNVGRASLLKPDAAVRFSQLNSRTMGADGAYKLHSYVDNIESTASQHLGYLAIADDDTPWSLRIEGVKFYNEGYLSSEDFDKIYKEGYTSGDTQALSYVITADKVCSNMPITITIVDGDGARATVTINVSVVSSKPSAIKNADTAAHERNEALLSVTENNRELTGVYQTYMVSQSVTQTKLTNVIVRDLDSANGTRNIANVYGVIDLPVNTIAYDPDEADNRDIALYTEGNDYDVFMFNDVPMENAPRTSNGIPVIVFYNDIFDIEVPADHKSFRIICKTYNPDSDMDTISFYVRDCGNNIFDNAIPISIRICTLYSSVTNEKQSGDAIISGSNVIREAYVNTVKVKSYDDYTGVSSAVTAMSEEERAKIVGVPSTYQFLNYYEVPDSVDNAASDAYRMNDPDVAINNYNKIYDVKVYALMDLDPEDNTTYKSKSLTEASALFEFNNARLGRYWYLRENANVQNYMVAGLRSSGSTYSGLNNSLVMYLQQYFVFELGADGLSLSFRPVTANINLDILFYVQIEKTVGSMRRISRSDATVKTGTLFYVKVTDSAPIANADAQALSFAGKIGDSYAFPIFDASNPYISMFTDSDVGDMVTVGGFTSSSNLTEDYNNALADADCDWQGRDGVSRAIDIAINNSDTDDTANGIPAHSLKITIRRRIDKRNEDGSYPSEVTFPVKFRGYDRENVYADVVLQITVQNSDFDMNQEKLDNSPQNFDAIGAGYEIKRGEEDRTYVIDSYIALDSAAINVNLVVDGWFSDPDFTSMAADTESFRLIRPSAENDPNANKYLYDAPLNVYATGEDKPVAVLTPIFGNNGSKEDSYHFAGFTITAGESTRRGITGTAYLRVLDRSGNANRSDTGIIIAVNVTTLNAAPSVILGKDNNEQVVIGSDSANGTPIRINVNDYVTDRNGDTLRIVGILPLDPEYIHCTTDTDNGESLIKIEVLDDTDEQIFTLTPRKGYYGKQSVQVMVADGDLSSDISARTASFTITITSIYDFAQVQTLNTVNAIRSLPTTVTPEILFPDIVDTFDSSVVSGGKSSARRGNVLASAEGDSIFNPGNDYIITNLTPNAPSIDVRQNTDEFGNIYWQFTCPREMDNLQFTATFIRRIDENNPNAQTFSKNFTAVVGKNSAPKLKDNFRRDGGFTFTTRDGDYGLNQNGTVTLRAEDLFDDEEVALQLGDKLVFDPSITSVVSTTMCSITFSEDNTLMYLTFNMRGETEITVGVKDLTGETVTATFIIKNIDRPEAAFFDSIKISYEKYPFIWLGVGIGVLALIVFIILLIILLKRRKRKREEIEAILLSEMELEEQMLRLSGGVGGAPYQSFGYLPPTMNVQSDAGLMLGSGGNAPAPDAVGLLGQASDAAPPPPDEFDF